MQTLKDRFNHQARQRYIDQLILWWLLLLLIEQNRRLQSEITYTVRKIQPSFRPR